MTQPTVTPTTARGAFEVDMTPVNMSTALNSCRKVTTSCAEKNTCQQSIHNIECMNTCAYLTWRASFLSNHFWNAIYIFMGFNPSSKYMDKLKIGPCHFLKLISAWLNLSIYNMLHVSRYSFCYLFPKGFILDLDRTQKSHTSHQITSNMRMYLLDPIIQGNLCDVDRIILQMGWS